MSEIGEYFRCAHCNGEFTKNRTDAEMMAESRNLFGEISEPDRAVICDDCFKEFMKWYKSQ